MKLGKSTFNEQMLKNTDVTLAYRIAEDAMVNNLTMKVAQKGIQRFLDKGKRSGGGN